MLGELLITLLQSVGIVLLVGVLLVAVATVILLMIFGAGSFISAIKDEKEEGISLDWDEMCPECREKLMSLLKGENDE